MTQETAVEGLEIVGPVSYAGSPRSSSGYGASAYGTTQPGPEGARWLLVRPDGRVTAYSGKVEYGQGIRSGFAVEVADELRVPIGNVDVVLGDTDTVPWDMGTFGSQSTARVGLQLRKAAATARRALLDLASARLDLPASDLICRDGAVLSASDPNRSLTYGELVAGSLERREIDDNAELTSAADFTVMGHPAMRPDGVDRVTGAAVYTQDVILPGMLFAEVVRPPSYHAKLRDIDTSVAERMPGVVSVVRDERIVAILCENDEAARAAVDVLQATWDEQPDQPSHLDMPELLANTADAGVPVQTAGSLDDGFAEADEVLEQTYFAPYVTNAPMEPRAAVADWADGRVTVRAGTQRPFGFRAELAQYLEIDEADVRVITPEIGGGFGAKSYYPTAFEAARLAKIAGRPVRVAYSRTEDTIWGSFRPSALITIRSGFKSDGTLTAWQYTAYHAGDRPMIGQRGTTTPYTVPNVAVTVHASDSPLRAGSYRSLGGAVNHFAREVHMDEIAHAVGVDPVELRLRNLDHPRFRRVLETAADRFGWASSDAPADRGFGVALGLDVGSYAATCVQLDVAGSEVKVERVTASLDCGLVVNPEGAKNQVEGSIVMGMGTALYEGIEFNNGTVLNPGFARYRVPRINDAPVIDVALVGDDDEPSTGAGEPAIVPIAAAISNAVFDRTGQRIRELPIQRQLR
jgi:CO/xanthine dehydrogenase Mo-binding subunit